MFMAEEGEKLTDADLEDCNQDSKRDISSNLSSHCHIKLLPDN